MHHITIIGLNGPIGSGKTTIAKHLSTQEGVLRMSFAAPLKDMSSACFGIPREWFDDASKKENPIEWLNGQTCRSLCQNIGLYLRETHGSDIFVRIMRNKINGLATAGGTKAIVIDDLRFDTEAEFICNETKGSIWRIENVEARGKKRAHASHETEQGISEEYVDEVLENPLQEEWISSVVQPLFDKSVKQEAQEGKGSQ